MLNTHFFSKVRDQVRVSLRGRVRVRVKVGKKKGCLLKRKEWVVSYFSYGTLTFEYTFFSKVRDQVRVRVRVKAG